MTRLDRYFLPTERQAPADAEALSHKLMVRAGLVRQVGAGLWTLAAGRLARAPERRADRPRGDATRSAARRCSCRSSRRPSCGSAAGRYDIDELFKLKDRSGRRPDPGDDATRRPSPSTSRSVVRSYRDLPMLLYHFQTKDRDEARPRAGVLRTREFIMKDAYSFDRDAEGLRRVLRASSSRPTTASSTACGLEWYRVESDVGMMGGIGRPRVHGAVPGGRERRRAGARLRRERRGRERRPAAGRAAPTALERRAAHARADDDRGRRRRTSASPAGTLLKAFPVVTESRGLVHGRSCAATTASTRSSSRNALGEAFRPAREDELAGAARPASSGRRRRRPDALDDGDRARAAT